MSLKKEDINSIIDSNDSNDNEDGNSTDEVSFDEEEKKFLDAICEDDDSDNEFKILLKFGYIVEIDNNKEICFELDSDKKELDKGLIAGLTQNDKIVDAYFLGNKSTKDKNIEFKDDVILANGKEYQYGDLRIHMTPNGAFVVSKDDNDLITKFDDDAYQMFSSVMGNNSDNTCVISVIDSKICACCLSDGEILWAHPIDIGKNIFDERTGELKTKKGEFHISDCYLRACIKKIYLHIDVEEPFSTLILGSVDNPFYEIENNNLSC